MEKTRIIIPGAIHRINKRSKNRNFLSKEQVAMLKEEYKIHLTTNNTEAKALKLLRGGKFVPKHTTPLEPSIDGRLVREIRKGKTIYQFN